MMGPQSRRHAAWAGALAFWLAEYSACAPAVGQNLVVNRGFESGTSGWYGLGCTFTAPTTLPRSGSRSGYASNRTQTWNGIAQNLLGVLTPGSEYQISAWVRLANTASSWTKFTMAQTDGAGTVWHSIDEATSTNTGWTELAGYFTLNVTGALTDLTLYMEGPPAGTSFYLDDVSVILLGDWREEADARIEQIRKRDLSLRVVDHLGRSQVQAGIHVRQTRHRFAFGSAITSTALNVPQYTDFFRENFEWAVPEWEAKWPACEPSQGVLTYGPTDQIVSFCQASGIKLRGHNIFWEVQEFVPDWVVPLNNTQLQAAMQNRINSVVGRYHDVFVHWDVNNEMLHGSFYRDRFGSWIHTWMFQQAHAVDSDCKLFVNDYNVVAGGQTEEYRAQIAGLLADGAPVHGIGFQGHFSSPAAVNPHAIKSRLDVLAGFGLPLWCTEYDVTAPDANERADSLEKLYRIAFSHPAVEGILMWGFWADRHWRGADAAIVDSDWTVNAAGQRYQALRREWTTSADGQTDNDGRFNLRGFQGEYEITVDAGTGPGGVAQLVLDPGAGAQEHTMVVRWTVPYDFDGDLDVDMSDFGHLQACYTRPPLSISADCKNADLNGDDLIDPQDAALFANCLAGAEVEVAPACRY
jgi:endo-1,4-beta-xylanase